MARLLGRLPKPIMRGQVAVAPSEFRKSLPQKAEMLRFFKPDLRPVVMKRTRHVLVGEPGDQIPCHVDGVQFDVGERMEQRKPASLSTRAPPWHIAGWAQFGAVWPAGPLGHSKCPRDDREPNLPPIPRFGRFPREPAFLIDIIGQYDRTRSLGERHSRWLARWLAR